ncbi:MAG TPA: hypothetical protein VF665_11600 [Longimicrobium sp.]|uniref:hypothetical protein n=1 Tax=Longimicrobium sp. TaxID=2029185 RepID=UPI002ED9550E
MMGRAMRVLAALAVIAATARGAAAQEVTAFVTGSVDGHDSNIALVGASARPAGLGLKPVVALQVYRLNYEAGDENVGVWSVTPSVGAAYRTSGGQVEGRVGYNFQSGEDDSDDDVDLPFGESVGEGGGRSGVVTSVQAQSWAARPELQGIASYNWRSEYIWSQAQAVLPVVQLNSGGNIGVGGEVVYQGQTTSPDIGERYSAVQVGPLVRWSTGRESSVLVGGGYKDSSTRGGTWYARVAFVRYGINLGLLD